MTRAWGLTSIIPLSPQYRKALLLPQDWVMAIGQIPAASLLLLALGQVLSFLQEKEGGVVWFLFLVDALYRYEFLLPSNETIETSWRKEYVFCDSFSTPVLHRA